MARSAARVARVVDAVERCAVVGVGEHAHGDLVSWRWREAIMRELRRRGVPFVVLCENLDFYVRGARRQGGRRLEFRRHESGGLTSFTPHLVAGSDLTREHMRVTRRVARLAGGHVYGIDAQAAGFPHLAAAPSPGDYVSRIAGASFRLWQAAPEAQRRDGALRNRLNADTILAALRSAPPRPGLARPGAPRPKLLYFAHNEHVATGCRAARENRAYQTEGALLRAALGDAYLSVATWAPRLWALWGARARRAGARDAAARVFVSPRARLPEGACWEREHAAAALGPEYTSADFDVVITDSATGGGARPTLLAAASQPS